MVKIAIYSGLALHYQCLGYIIEFCKEKQFNFTIFAFHQYIRDNTLFKNDEGIMWKRFYDTLWQKYDWKLPQLEFQLNDFDIIFIITDDDNTFKPEWIELYKHKIIVIDHYYKKRIENSIYNIGTRFFINNPSKLWAMPCFEGITKLEKIKYNCENNTNNIIRVLITGGDKTEHPTEEILQRLFANFNDIHFFIVNRTINNYNSNNIMTFSNLYNETYFDIYKQVDYILCCDAGDKSIDACTSAIFLSFTFGIKLLLPETWQQNYKFKSAITYKDFNSQLTLPPVSKIDLNKIFYERQELIDHRNNVFDKTIQTILQK